MATRSFKMISVSPRAIEGVGIARGESGVASSLTHLLPPSEADPLVHLLQQFEQRVESAGWDDSPVTLVFPSSEISIRKLEFPFKEQKKIDQALAFELDNELLEDVAEFTYKHTIVPHKDGSAEVLVYLIPNDYLQAFLTLFQNRNMTPVKATFSAQALCEAHPAPSGRHYQVYLGLDEFFVSCVLEQQVHVVKSFSVRLAGLTGNGREPAPEAAPKTAAQILEMLNAANEEEEDAEPGLRRQWLADLERLSGELMRFIRPHSLGEPYTVSLHGLFAPLFDWDPEDLQLSVRLPADPKRAFAGTALLGILDEIIADPLPFTSPKGVNFFAYRSGWLTQLRGYTKLLAAMAVLLLLTLGLAGVNYGLSVADRRAELQRVEAEIQAALKRVLPGRHTAAAGVRLLEQRMQKLQGQGASAERFRGYRYESMGFLQDLSGLFREFPQLTLRSVSMNQERYTITGTTSSYNDSETFKNRLAAQERFRGKEPAITHQRAGGSITYRIVIER